MAFPLSLANFLVALQWFIYGSQLKDYFIQVTLIALVALYFYDSIIVLNILFTLLRMY